MVIRPMSRLSRLGHRFELQRLPSSKQLRLAADRICEVLKTEDRTLAVSAFDSFDDDPSRFGRRRRWRRRFRFLAGFRSRRTAALQKLISGLHGNEVGMCSRITRHVRMPSSNGLAVGLFELFKRVVGRDAKSRARFSTRHHGCSSRRAERTINRMAVRTSGGRISHEEMTSSTPLGKLWAKLETSKL